MDRLFKSGRYVFAASIFAFGAENLMLAHLKQDVVPVMPWVPGFQPLAYLTGLALATAGICIAANLRPRLVSILLGLFFLVCAVAIQAPLVVAHPLDIGIRTTAFETLILCATSLILAGMLPAERFNSMKWERAEDALILCGRYLFAVSCIVFGADHLPIIAFIASLIPAWIPGPYFWAWFTAFGFLAAGLSIAANIWARWGAGMLGLMFFLWVLVLHGPRVVSYPRSHNPNEWSSALIALAICGGSWILAESLGAEAPQAAPVRDRTAIPLPR